MNFTIALQAGNQLNNGWNDLPLQKKGLVIIALPLGALLVGLVCFYMVMRAEHRQEKWVDQTLQVRSELGQLLNDLVDAETGVRGYLLTRRDAFLQPYAAGLKALPISISRISDLIQDSPVQVAQFRKVQLNVRARLEKFNSVILSVAGRQGPTSPVTTEELLEGKAIMDDLRQELDRMDKEESRLMAGRVAELSRVRNWSSAAFAGAGLLGVLGGGLAAWLFSKGIVLRLRFLEENTRRLSQGIPLLSSPVRSDEVGRLELKIKGASLLLAERGYALVQSQKLEIVGRLAGGIAHEFNSILTVILGQSELLLNDLPPDNPFRKNAAEIRNVAERAATLTRQLLASGRRQILQPEILDLNSILAGMESVLLHLLGPDVALRIKPAAGLKAVQADADQIEQVIMNMAMNAAAAMPQGGALTFETSNVSFLQGSARGDSEFEPGDYVMLAITDTGVGMSVEMKAHVFEPFYLIQGFGQRPGMGLSACYGIIKQSGGHISVESEPQLGATFKIYLPLVEKRAGIPLPKAPSSDLPRGTETILLVEEHSALRKMAANLLERLGYTVLPAANGNEALRLNQGHDPGRIDLLLTNDVMPHMSGKELADRVLASNPQTRILFTSGYNQNATVPQGHVCNGLTLLQKPFTPSALARKVRKVLDHPGAPEPLESLFASPSTMRKPVNNPD
ncbi:MAG: CHASE3 domain-containing protein [Verrucomicrobiota bacterium]